MIYNNTFPITITESALKKIKSLLNQVSGNCMGIRLTLKEKGCSGLSYNLDYSNGENSNDEIFTIDEKTKIFIDSKAMLYLIGMEMDFIEDIIESGFVFKNPNEKGRCGCGKSFHI